MNIWLFMLFYVLQLSLSVPTFFTTCKQIDLPVLLLYFGHHLTDVFLFWGPLFMTNNYERALHLAFVLGVIVHWFTYNNRCIATVKLNEQCGYDEDQWLDSMLNHVNLRERSEYFQFLWLGVVVAYDIYYLRAWY